MSARLFGSRPAVLGEFVVHAVGMTQIMSTNRSNPGRSVDQTTLPVGLRVSL